jgi:hypothetical protein
MPIPIAVPIVGGLVVATGTVLALRAKKKNADIVAATRAGAVVPPNFTASPPATIAVPAGSTSAGLPVITQDQFNSLSQADKDNIAAVAAIQKIATLSGTQGTLFASKAMDPVTAAGGAFSQRNLNNTDFDDAGATGLKVTVDAQLAKSRGLDLSPVTSGNVLFQCTGRAGAETVPGVSLDPRLPNKTADIPNFAITGAGDI